MCIIIDELDDWLLALLVEHHQVLTFFLVFELGDCLDLFAFGEVDEPLIAFLAIQLKQETRGLCEAFHRLFPNLELLRNRLQAALLCVL